VIQGISVSSGEAIAVPSANAEVLAAVLFAVCVEIGQRRLAGEARFFGCHSPLRPDRSKLHAIPSKALACDERIRLLLACSKAARDYSDAVSMMGAGARSSDFAVYRKAVEIAECCRLILKQTRIALNGHVAEHGCRAHASTE
jgi:hypothetical protein